MMNDKFSVKRPRAFLACLGLLPAVVFGCRGTEETEDHGYCGGVYMMYVYFSGPQATLDGWVRVLDSAWIVDDEGHLVSDQDPAGRREGESWLLTEKDYEDFELTLEFRIAAGGNSGVFIRDPIPRADRLAAEDGGPPPWEAGYEVNINGDEPNYPTGSVWATAKGAPGLQRDDEWNQLEIRVVGQTIWTKVNGKTALDGVELPPRSKRGAIGFQRHGGEAYRDRRIEFRRVRIREV